MGLVQKILAYRLDIDIEFQSWILMFAAMTVVFLFCLPCYCSGLSCHWARQFSNRSQRHLPKFIFLMALFNGAWMYVLVAWLPDYNFPQVLKGALSCVGFLVANIVMFLGNFIHIAVFIFVIVFRERIALILGIDHLQIFKFKTKDCCQCFSGGYRAIELSIWKVEELAAGDIFNANNVFVEVHLGNNETMKTRVHNNAGSECMVKERLQLNFDDYDEDEQMYIFIKNQKVMGATDLGRVDLTGSDVKNIEARSKSTSMSWGEANFVKKSVHPTGTIHLRIDSVDEEQGGGLMRDLTQC